MRPPRISTGSNFPTSGFNPIVAVNIGQDRFRDYFEHEAEKISKLYEEATESENREDYARAAVIYQELQGIFALRIEHGYNMFRMAGSLRGQQYVITFIPFCVRVRLACH
jgi:hypothetical protein